MKQNYIKILEQEAIDLPETMSNQEKEQLKKKLQKHMEEQIKMRAKKRNKIHMAWKTAAAIALTIAAVPTCVYAYEEISDYFKSTVEKEGYQIEVNIEQPEETIQMETNTLTTKSSVQPVMLIYPDFKGYTVDDNIYEEEYIGDAPGYYDFIHKDGYESGKEFDLTLIQIDTNTDKNFFIRDAKEMDRLKIDGQDAIYIQTNEIIGSQYNKDTDYGQQLIVFYEHFGYVMLYDAQNGLSKDSFIEYANQISLKKCEASKASPYESLSNYLAHNPMGMENTETDASTDAVAPLAIISKDDVIIKDGVSYELLDLKVTDNIKEYIEQGDDVACYGWGDTSKYTSKDGTLKSYIREVIEDGNGIDTPIGEIANSEEINQKFVLLTIKVKNTTNKTLDSIEVGNRMCYLSEGDEPQLIFPNYRIPSYLEELRAYSDGPTYFKEANVGKGFFLKDFKAGQEEIYHMGYLIDEDYLDQMVLCFDNGMSKDKNRNFWDLRQ
ncbi:MAG: hypothetical protein II992_10390 [Lachnospiraceae bacterium]|nr:hypothetical protein [Lachnospiraceae bacterium]